MVVKSLLMKDEHLFFEFKQEMEMYSKLDHPFIVKLLGVCRDLEPHFMIMEYCDWVREILSRIDNGFYGSYYSTNIQTTLTF